MSVRPSTLITFVLAIFTVYIFFHVAANRVTSFCVVITCNGRLEFRLSRAMVGFKMVVTATKNATISTDNALTLLFRPNCSSTVHTIVVIVVYLCFFM